MARVSFAALHQNMMAWTDRVSDDSEPLLVIRQGGKGNVMIPAQEEFPRRQETMRLLSSSQSATNLLASIRQLDAGRGQVRELMEDEAFDAA